MDADGILTVALEAHSIQLKRVEKFKHNRHLFKRALKIVEEGKYYLGISGLRGIGKTTLLSQLAKEVGGLYISADNRAFRGIELYDIIRALSDKGYNKIFIDEIHAKPNWDVDLKSCYDEGLADIAFTGSSAIRIKALSSDLSRRAIIEELRPASFREWLSIKKGISVPVIKLNSVIRNKRRLVEKYGYINKYKEEYYKYGGVLYEVGIGFEKTIISMLETMLIKDISTIKAYDPEMEEDFYKVLYAIASSRPIELSYEKIGNAIGKNKVWVMRFLKVLKSSGVVKAIPQCGSGTKAIRKEAKYYLPFPYRSSLCQTYGIKPNLGSLREEFLVNHLENLCYVKTANVPTPDFLAEGKTFEVGGERKKKKQGADVLVIDGLDTSGEKVPLFLFGLLY